MREQQDFLHNQAFNKMIKYISWAGLAVSLAITIMRVFVLNEPWINVVHGVAFIPLVTASLIGIYKFENYHIGRWAILSYFLFIQPWHIWRTGGLYSFGAVWFLVMIPYAAIFFSKKTFWSVFTWFSLIMIYLVFNPTEVNPIYFEFPQLAARAFTVICAFVILWTIVRISMIQRDKLKEEFNELEKKKMLADTAISLAHEINNPLAIISLRAELLKRKGVDAELLEPLQESVERIHKSVTKLKSLSEQKKAEVEPPSDSL